jgi:hypothetical protein
VPPFAARRDTTVEGVDIYRLSVVRELWRYTQLFQRLKDCMERDRRSNSANGRNFVKRTVSEFDASGGHRRFDFEYNHQSV